MRSSLQTDRLVLRHFTTNDAEFIINLVNTENWIRNIGDVHVTNTTQALTYLALGPLSSYRKTGYGSYMITLKVSEEPVGMCSLMHREWLKYPDLGFAILPEYCRKGYAFEAAAACMTEVYNNSVTPHLSAIVAGGNTASVKLLEKLEFGHHEMVRVPGSNEELHMYLHTPAQMH
jgi:[ribosomal protein S5]-alanine N-acetyltransferase